MQPGALDEKDGYAIFILTDSGQPMSMACPREVIDAMSELKPGSRLSGETPLQHWKRIFRMVEGIHRDNRKIAKGRK